jgi:hypothetical protein
MLRRALVAFAVAALLGSASDARAGIVFSFSTTPSIAVDPQATTTVFYTGNAGSSETTTDIKVGFIDLTAPTGSGGVASGPIDWEVAITDTASGFSDTFTLSLTLTGSVTTTSSFLTFTWTTVDGGPKQIGNNIYTVTAKFVDVPTIQSSGPVQGSLTATVTATPIPEPSTVVMAGLGGLGLLGTAVRRRGKLGLV